APHGGNDAECHRSVVLARSRVRPTAGAILWPDWVEDVPLFYLAGVGPLGDEAAAIGAPPVAMHAVHFFLGDELGEAMLEVSVRAGGELPWGSPLGGDDKEFPLRDVAHLLRVGRKLRIDGAGVP